MVKPSAKSRSKKAVTRKKRVTAASKAKPKAKPKPKKLEPKTPRKGGGRRGSLKQAQAAARINEEMRRRQEFADGSVTTSEEKVAVLYTGAFVTGWTGYTNEVDLAKWRREKLLYGIIKMSDRFTVHETEQRRILIKNTTYGRWTTIISVYVEFTDNQTVVPVSELGNYTDPMQLLEELGLNNV